MKGIFYGIGVGPGDPELLTIKGQRLLQEADIIALPKTRGDKASTAWNIVKDLVGEKKLLDIIMPMTNNSQVLQEAWQNGAASIAEKLAEGYNVAFITLGDPSLFSTFNYLYQILLTKGYEAHIVPGINSPSATAAVLGCGLADGKENLIIMPACDDLSSLAHELEEHDNLVLMKGAASWKDIAAILETYGDKISVSGVELCGMENQRIFSSLQEIPLDGLSYFFTAIIRKDV
ncbi:MAG: precorrin-2 C(20)-methyltransferase [Clostridiales bacterium]